MVSEFNKYEIVWPITLSYYNTSNKTEYSGIFYLK